MRKGSMDLPLHGGKCPPWLFKRMRSLASGIVDAIVDEYSASEVLMRLANPLWFQALGCTLGYDWHSSGLTTTVCAAIREGLKENSGLAVAGGKGKASLKTPMQIKNNAEIMGLSTNSLDGLIKASRLCAKVDSSCVQDGYELYHHVIFFDENGNWTVVQQGMKEECKYARRYHWSKTCNFTESPEQNIIGLHEQEVLNLVSKEHEEIRKSSVDLINDNPAHLERYFTGQTTLFGNHYVMPARHPVLKEDLTMEDLKILKAAYEMQPENYEQLILLRGMGKKKLRALALVSRLMFGTEIDWKDPVKYSWSHGGKDGYPYPVDRETYANSIEFLRGSVEKARIGERDRVMCLKSLASFAGQA